MKKDNSGGSYKEDSMDKEKSRGPKSRWRRKKKIRRRRDYSDDDDDKFIGEEKKPMRRF